MSVKRAIPGTHRPFRLLTVLDRMIAVDLLKTVTAVLSVLVIIIVSRKFIRVLSQAIAGNISNDIVFKLLGLKIVAVASTFLPAAIFMAVLMVLGRMYREQEIAAIASAGGGLSTIYRGVFWLVLPLSLCSAWLSMVAAPWAEAQTLTLMHQDQETADVRSISAGRFSEYSGGELIFYTEGVDEAGNMQHVFVQNKQGERTGIVNAERGHMESLPGGLYLVLEQGERILGVPGNRDFTIETFKQYAVRIENKVTEMLVGSQALATEQLWRSTNLIDIAELQDRLNAPIGVMLLAFLAVPLSKLSPRGGVYGSMLVAFGIYFAYSNLLRVNYGLVIGGKIPVWFGYFWIDLLLLLVGAVLLFRLYGWKWLIFNLTKGR